MSLDFPEEVVHHVATGGECEVRMAANSIEVNRRPILAFLMNDVATGMVLKAFAIAAERWKTEGEDDLLGGMKLTIENIQLALPGIPEA